MTNPTPRPALRKAEDATVHPAAPRPARSSRASASKAPEVAAAPEPAASVAPPPAAAPDPSPAPAPRKSVKPAKQSRPRPMPPVSGHGKRGKRKFGGSTSDHLRPDLESAPDPADAAVVGVREKTPRSARTPKPAAPPAETVAAVEPPKSSKKKAQRATRDDLMQGKPVDLDVAVPKALRKAAAKRAKSEGLDLQTVVIDALHAYVTRPPL